MYYADVRHEEADGKISITILQATEVRQTEVAVVTEAQEQQVQVEMQDISGNEEGNSVSGSTSGNLSSDAATKKLFHLHSTMPFTKLKFKTKEQRWRAIALKMTEDGYKCTAEQCRNRYNTLEKCFKRVQDNKKKLREEG